MAHLKRHPQNADTVDRTGVDSRHKTEITKIIQVKLTKNKVFFENSLKLIFFLDNLKPMGIIKINAIK